MAFNTLNTSVPPEIRNLKLKGQQENIAISALKGSSREGSRTNLFQEPSFDSSLLAAEIRKKTPSNSNEGITELSHSLKRTAVLDASKPEVAVPIVLEKRTAKPMSPTSLSELLHGNASKLLLLDVRSLQEFCDLKIKNSANIILPSLILKRIKKGGISSFQLENFLTNEVSKEVYKDWFQATEKGEGSIVVYDEDINHVEDPDSDSYILLKAILGSQLVTTTRPNLSVYFLNGGINAFQQDQSCRAYLDGTAAAIQQVQHESLSTQGVNANVPQLSLAPVSISPISTTTSHYETPTLTISGSSPVGATFDSVTDPLPPRLPHKSVSTPVESLGTPLLTSPGGGKIKRSSFAVTIGPSPTRGVPSASSSTPSIAEPSTPIVPKLAHISDITEFILLGSEVVPTAADAGIQLDALGVTHVLNMAKEVRDEVLMGGGEQARGIKFKWIGVYDHPDEEIDGPIREGVQFMREARESHGGKVLVHCKAGRSRSVAVVLAYLIMEQKMTLKDAYDLVSTKRNGIIPNIGFMLALMQIERETLGFNTEISGPSSLSGTRSI